MEQHVKFGSCHIVILLHEVVVSLDYVIQILRCKRISEDNFDKFVDLLSHQRMFDDRPKK